MKKRSSRLEDRGKEDNSTLLRNFFHMIRIVIRKGLNLEGYCRKRDEQNRGEVSKSYLIYLLRKVGLPFTPRDIADIVRLYSVPSNSDNVDYESFFKLGSNNDHKEPFAPANSSSNNVGTNSNTGIDINTFTSVVETVKTMLIECMSTLGKEVDEIYRMFARWDTDGTGTITAAQFLRVLARLCVELPDHDQDLLVEMLDADGMGRIDFEGLLTFCFMDLMPELHSSQQNISLRSLCIGRDNTQTHNNNNNNSNSSTEFPQLDSSLSAVSDAEQKSVGSRSSSRGSSSPSHGPGPALSKAQLHQQLQHQLLRRPHTAAALRSGSNETISSREYTNMQFPPDTNPTTNNIYNNNSNRPGGRIQDLPGLGLGPPGVGLGHLRALKSARQRPLTASARVSTSCHRVNDKYTQQQQQRIRSNNNPNDDDEGDEGEDYNNQYGPDDFNGDDGDDNNNALPFPGPRPSNSSQMDRDQERDRDRLLNNNHYTHNNYDYNRDSTRQNNLSPHREDADRDVEYLDLDRDVEPQDGASFNDNTLITEQQDQYQDQDDELTNTNFNYGSPQRGDIHYPPPPRGLGTAEPRNRDHLSLLASQTLSTVREMILSRYRNNGKSLHELFRHFDRTDKRYFDALDFMKAAADLRIETSERVADLAVREIAIDSYNNTDQQQVKVSYAEFKVFVLDFGEYKTLEVNVQQQLAQRYEKHGRDFVSWLRDIFYIEEGARYGANSQRKALQGGFVSVKTFTSTLDKIGLRLSGSGSASRGSGDVDRLVARFDVYGQGMYCSVPRFLRMVEGSGYWRHAETVLALQEESIREADIIRQVGGAGDRGGGHMYKLNNGIAMSPELLSMAEYLGIRAITESHMLWIAADALKAPLPVNWTAEKDGSGTGTETGRTFFFNHITKQSRWDHPLDPHFRKLRDKYRQSEQEIGAASAEAAAGATAPPQHTGNSMNMNPNINNNMNISFGGPGAALNPPPMSIKLALPRPLNITYSNTHSMPQPQQQGRTQTRAQTPLLQAHEDINATSTNTNRSRNRNGGDNNNNNDNNQYLPQPHSSAQTQDYSNKPTTNPIPNPPLSESHPHHYYQQQQQVPISDATRGYPSSNPQDMIITEPEPGDLGTPVPTPTSVDTSIHKHEAREGLAEVAASTPVHVNVAAAVALNNINNDDTFRSNSTTPAHVPSTMAMASSLPKQPLLLPSNNSNSVYNNMEYSTQPRDTGAGAGTYFQYNNHISSSSSRQDFSSRQMASQRIYSAPYSESNPLAEATGSRYPGKGPGLGKGEDNYYSYSNHNYNNSYGNSNVNYYLGGVGAFPKTRSIRSATGTAAAGTGVSATTGKRRPASAVDKIVGYGKDQPGYLLPRTGAGPAGGGPGGGTRNPAVVSGVLAKMYDEKFIDNLDTIILSAKTEAMPSVQTTSAPSQRPQQQQQQPRLLQSSSRGKGGIVLL